MKLGTKIKLGIAGGISMIIGIALARNQLYQYYKQLIEHLQAQGIKCKAEDLETIQGAVSLVDAGNRIEEAAESGEITNTTLIKIVKDQAITDDEQQYQLFRTSCIAMAEQKMVFFPPALIAGACNVIKSGRLTQAQAFADIDWVVARLNNTNAGPLPY